MIYCLMSKYGPPNLIKDDNMQRPMSSNVKNMRVVALAAIFVVSLNGCAHELTKKNANSVKPVYINSSADVTVEIAAQSDLMDKAYIKHTDILAPIHFKKAKTYLALATQEYQKGDSSTEVLRSLGYSRAHLNKANNMASKVVVNQQVDIVMKPSQLM